MSQYGCDLALSHRSLIGFKRFNRRDKSLVSVEPFCRAVVSYFAHDAFEQRWCDNALYWTAWTGTDVVVESIWFVFKIARATEAPKATLVVFDSTGTPRAATLLEAWTPGALAILREHGFGHDGKREEEKHESVFNSHVSVRHIFRLMELVVKPAMWRKQVGLWTYM